MHGRLGQTFFAYHGNVSCSGMMCWPGFLSLTTKAVAEREKLQTPRLRCAPVPRHAGAGGMTRVGRLLVGRSATWMDGVKSGLLRSNCRSLHCLLFVYPFETLLYRWVQYARYKSPEINVLQGAEPKRSGKGLQSLFWVVRFHPAPPTLPCFTPPFYCFRRNNTFRPKQ
jgi:hypothetical protein